MAQQAGHEFDSDISVRMGPRLRGDDENLGGGVAAVPIKQSFVYILASGRHGTLYIGVTSDLMVRLYQHREGLTGGFTKRYGVNRLVYFEVFEDISEAIGREKRLKKWNRDWKIRLIQEGNPDWSDLAIGMGFEPVHAKIGANGSPPSRG